jgi:hypothetical protein
MLVLTQRYIEKVRVSHPRLYEKNFAEGSRNSKAIKQLLKLTERGYRRWLTALRHVGEKPTQPETDLWQVYQELKTGKSSSRFDIPELSSSR